MKNYDIRLSGSGDKVQIAAGLEELAAQLRALTESEIGEKTTIETPVVCATLKFEFDPAMDYQDDEV